MRWIVAALIIGLLSGCSANADESRGEPVPKRSAADLATVRAQAGIIAPSPTTTPRREPATPTPTREARPAAGGSTRPDPGFATDASLLPALLDPAELPMNWTAGQDQGLGVASFCGSPSIEMQFESLGWAYGSYSAASGEWAEHWIVRLTELDAQAAMEYVRSSLTCDTETMPGEPGNDLYWEYSPLEISPLGDDQYARSFDITFQNPAYTPQAGNVVFVRKGEFIVVVLHWGFNAGLDTTDLIVRMAIERLALIGSNQV